MKPLVSVIIPFYRNVEWLVEAVESVRYQSYDNIEIIVINDGSSEILNKFLEIYEDEIKYIYQENAGAAAARNRGIEEAKGDYLAFLDSDDIWDSQKIEKQVKYMIENGFIWSHTSYIKFSEKKDLQSVDVSKFYGNVFPMTVIASPIATPCVMIQSNILKYDKSLRFNEKMKSGEDMYLWMKLSMKYELGMLDDYLTNVRMRGSNAALLSYSQIRARAQIWKIIKEDETISINEFNICLRIAFYLCQKYYNILGICRKKIGLKEKIIEDISKILYIFPWSIFKLKKIIWSFMRRR